MIATIADVARIAGCSNATVSRVANNLGQVSEEMRDAVLRAMKQLNYAPRPNSVPLQAGAAEPATDSNELRLLELILFSDEPYERLTFENSKVEIAPLSDYPEDERLAEGNWLSNSFYRSIVDGILYEAPHWNFKTAIQVRRDLTDPAFVASLNAPAIGGVMIAGASTPELTNFVRSCTQPLVLVDVFPESNCNAPIITFDNTEGIEKAFDHLYALGHREFGMLAGPQSIRPYRERLTGVRYKMAEHGLAVRNEWIYTGAQHIATTAAWCGEMLKHARPTAMLSCNDFMAIALCKTASELGISVPGQLSVVGFDDIVPASLVTPALTTVRTPTFETGRQAVQQMSLQIELGSRRNRRGSTVRLSPELVLWGSTAAPAK